MNSINWPISSVWVFIAQLVEHCSANAEATGSNPVEAAKTFFVFRAISLLLKLRFTVMVTYSFDLYNPAVHIISFCVSFLSRVDELNKLACSCLQCMGVRRLHSSAGRAL